jgi:hypothetical protein
MEKNLPSKKAKNVFPLMIYMSKEEIRDAKKFAKSKRVSVSMVAREGIQMRIGSADNPYVGGFNDGLKCAMEAARNTHGGQMMFPSGVTFAEMVCVEIERMFRERPTVSELGEEEPEGGRSVSTEPV